MLSRRSSVGRVPALEAGGRWVGTNRLDHFASSLVGEYPRAGEGRGFESHLVIYSSGCRLAAMARALGARIREFESLHSDHFPAARKDVRGPSTIGPSTENTKRSP